MKIKRQGIVNLMVLTFILTFILTTGSYASDFDGWRVMPIRSEEEFNQGKIGGEAEQHLHGIARSPSNPDIIYLSHDVGQVWKSIDGGDSWRKTLGINLSLICGQSIEVDPVDPDIVFFIVSPAWNWLAEEYGGLYRSKDGGDTWEFILPMNVEVKRTYQHSIAYDPASVIGNQTMTWYVATIGDGLFRSDDGGNSWTESLGLKKEIKTNVFTQGYEDSKWPARLMFNGVYTDTSVLGLLNFKINYKFNETKNLDHIDFYQGDWQGTYDYAKELLIKFDDGSSMNATLEQLPWTKQTINLNGKQVQNMSITIISVYENPNPSVNWGGFAEIDVINDAGEDVTIWDEGISTIYDIKCHQTDGKTVYAGTDKGLYCSNNKGENMNPCGNLPSGAVSSIAINPQNPDMIYVVIRNNGLYRSLDGGNTFSLLRSFDATKVFINFGYPDVIYLVGINSNTIISHDGGATWITDMQTVPAPGLGRGTSWKRKIAGDLTGIVPNLNNENEAVAFSRATIWKTTDGGRYFNDSSTLFTGYAWGWWNDGIAFDPNNQDKFATFNCDVGMTITNNSTDYFDRRNDQAWGWYQAGNISWIGAYSGDFQPIPGSQIIVASIGNYWSTQLMRTSDEGKNWELVTQNSEQNLFIAFHPNDPNLVYAGDKISNNAGQTFSKVDFGAYNTYNPSILGMCRAQPDTLYALDSARRRILRSDDRGVTWRLYAQPGWRFIRLDSLPTFAVDPVDPNKVYTLDGSYDLAVYDGNSWRSMGVLALAGGSELNNFVRTVAIDPNHPEIIYAGMHAAGIPCAWRSIDGGYTWEDITNNHPRIGIGAMAVSPHTGEVFIGSACGTRVLPPPYESSNLIYDKLVSMALAPVASIIATPLSGEVPLEVIFDGSDSYDKDGSIISYKWDFGDGSTSTEIKILHIYTSVGKYTVTLSITDSQGFKGESQTYITVFEKVFGNLPTGCYNNVFNPTKGEKALIIVELPKKARVKLGLYNTRSNRIRELADEEKEAGTHKYYWDGKNDSGNVVGSGLYFVHIRAGGYKKTKKVVVIK